MFFVSPNSKRFYKCFYLREESVTQGIDTEIHMLQFILEARKIIFLLSYDTCNPLIKQR